VAGSGRSIAVAAGSIAAITIVSRLVGFGRWFAFSHSVGATCVGTVYQSVNAVPNVLYEVAAGGVLAAVVIPLVSAALGRGERGRADQTASALLTWALAVLVPLALVVVVAAAPIAELLLPTAGCAGALGLGADLLRLFAIQVPLYGVGIVLAGVLQSHRRFVGAALAPLLSSVVAIVTYVVYRALVPDPAASITTIPRVAVLVLGLGTSLGVVALSLPLLVPLHRAGIRLRPTLRFPDSASSRVRRLAFAGLLALVGQQLATLVVIRLANDRGGAGTLNVFTYVQAVSLLPYAVLAVPLATAAFPTLAGQDAGTAQSRDTAARTLRGAWLGTLIAGVYGVGLLIAVAQPVGAFFSALDAGRGSGSGAEALAAIPTTIVAFAPGIIGLGAIGVLTRALYVRGHARTAGATAGAGWLLTLVVPLVALTGSSGPGDTLRAIGIGSSIGLVAAALVLAVLAARAWGGAALRPPGRPLVAALLGGGAAAVGGWWLGTAWRPTDLTGAALATIAAGLLATLAFAAVSGATDRSVVRRLVRRDPAGDPSGDRT
jgi:putative peptidoglycan lipid II flippase